MARADHIYVPRRGGLYFHHGIDAGDGTVIHFNGEPGSSKSKASIIRTQMIRFLDGAKRYVRAYGKRDDADTIIARAESRIDDKDYHLVFNNCEHFATWCCTGLKSSQQVIDRTAQAANGGVVAATLGATAGVVSTLGVSGLSGAGIMSGLATAGSVIGGGAALGPAVIGVAPAALSVRITGAALRDDETLPDNERKARFVGRTASKLGAGAATAGGVAAISAAGTTAGLSAAGISTGLAAIGGTVGGGMVAGTALIAAAPAVAAAGVGVGAFLLSKRLRRPKGDGPDQLEAGVPTTSPTPPDNLAGVGKCVELREVFSVDQHGEVTVNSAPVRRDEGRPTDHESCDAHTLEKCHSDPKFRLSSHERGLSHGAIPNDSDPCESTMETKGVIVVRRLTSTASSNTS